MSNNLYTIVNKKLVNNTNSNGGLTDNETSSNKEIKKRQINKDLSPNLSEDKLI